MEIRSACAVRSCLMPCGDLPVQIYAAHYYSPIRLPFEKVESGAQMLEARSRVGREDCDVCRRGQDLCSV